LRAHSQVQLIVKLKPSLVAICWETPLPA